MRPCSESAKRSASASPFGTRAACGHAASSAGLAAFQMGWTCWPCCVVPLGSKKNAPVVSPAQAHPRVSWMAPAACRPELKTYCCGEPLGQ